MVLKRSRLGLFDANDHLFSNYCRDSDFNYRLPPIYQIPVPSSNEQFTGNHNRNIELRNFGFMFGSFVTKKHSLCVIA